MRYCPSQSQLGLGLRDSLGQKIQHHASRFEPAAGRLLASTATRPVAYVLGIARGLNDCIRTDCGVYCCEALERRPRVCHACLTCRTMSLRSFRDAYVTTHSKGAVILLCLSLPSSSSASLESCVALRRPSAGRRYVYMYLATSQVEHRSALLI
jgi:hypothetical protein